MGKVMWTVELHEALREAVGRGREQGRPILEVLRQFADDHGATYNAVSTYYYRHITRGERAPRSAARQESAPAQASKEEPQGRRATPFGVPWSEREKQELFEMIELLRADGDMSLNEIYEKLQREMFPSRTVRAIREQYRLMRQERARRQGKFGTTSSPLQSAEQLPLDGQNGSTPALPRALDRRTPREFAAFDLLDSLSRLAQAALHIDGFQLEPFMEGLAQIAGLAAKAADAESLQAQIDTLQQHLAERDGQIAELNAKLATYTDELKQAREIINKSELLVETANALLDEFSQLRSLEKIATLADFRNRVRTTVDDSGTVLKTIDEWKERFDQLLLAETKSPTH